MTTVNMPEKDRSHLSIVRINGDRTEAPKDRNTLPSLQAKRQQKEEEDARLVPEMIRGAQRILQREFIGKLPPDQATVMWGVFSLKSERQIAKEMGISVTEVKRLRSEAEQTLGRRLNF